MRTSYKIAAAAISYLVFTVVLVASYANASIASTMASVALVILTAALVYATLAYTEAA
jgi:hypothetical protein